MARDVMRNRMVGNRMVRGLNGLVRVRDRSAHHRRLDLPGLHHNRGRRVHSRTHRHRVGVQRTNQHARDKSEKQDRPATPAGRPVMPTGHAGIHTGAVSPNIR
jgi:hypothetical protein